MSDCEFDPNEVPTAWSPGADEEREKKGDKPPKGGKGTKKGGKKPKDKRENPDFDDVPGYETLAFRADTDFRPPNPTQMPQGQAPELNFTGLPNLSEDDCREALMKYVEDNLCFGKKPAENMEITSIKACPALHYILETFTESRSTKKKKKPYKGGGVDGPENGTPPQPWEIDVSAKKKFDDDKIKKEVPHTAKVKKCKDCKGRGWETCDECDGWGKVECETCDGGGNVTGTDAEGNECEQSCMHCFGDGNKTCGDCAGIGRTVCDDCEGYKKLKCFIQLKVKFRNHKDDYILETTDMPDELVASVGGNVLFEDEQLMLWPINGFPVQEINENSWKLVDKHSKQWPDELIKMQKHVLRGVPVTEVAYKWEDFSSRYWVYGTERKVYAPDYPQQTCCGCSII